MFKEINYSLQHRAQNKHLILLYQEGKNNIHLRLLHKHFQIKYKWIFLMKFWEKCFKWDRNPIRITNLFIAIICPIITSFNLQSLDAKKKTNRVIEKWQKSIFPRGTAFRQYTFLFETTHFYSMLSIFRVPVLSPSLCNDKKFKNYNLPKFKHCNTMLSQTFMSQVSLQELDV